MLKVHFGLWVEKYGLVKNLFYRYECREVVIGLNTNLACVSKLGEQGLVVYDYPFICQRQHHFVPDRDFFATLLLISSHFELLIIELPKLTSGILMEIATILVVLVDQFYLYAPAHKTLGF